MSIEQKAERRGERSSGALEQWSSESSAESADSAEQWVPHGKRKRDQGAGSREQGAGDSRGEACQEEEGKIRKKMRISTGFSSNTMAPPHNQVEPMEVD